MATHINPLAGKPAPISSLINVAKLVTAYHEFEPDHELPWPIANATDSQRGAGER
jgi:phosphoglucomutase